MNDCQDVREEFQAAIRMALPSSTGVVLEAKAGLTGRVVVVELPDEIAPWPQMGQGQRFYVQPTISVAVVVTPPWDSEGGRRLTNDVVGAMSAIAKLNCLLTPAIRGTIDLADGVTLPCYRFTAQYPKPVEG